MPRSTRSWCVALDERGTCSSRLMVERAATLRHRQLGEQGDPDRMVQHRGSCRAHRHHRTAVIRSTCSSCHPTRRRPSRTPRWRPPPTRPTACAVRRCSPPPAAGEPSLFMARSAAQCDRLIVTPSAVPGPATLRFEGRDHDRTPGRKPPPGCCARIRAGCPP